MFLNLKRIKKSNDLAEKLFEYRVYQPYVEQCPDKTVRSICKNCMNIQDSLNKVIEYCEEPVTPQARYLYAITYAWSRVLYNERAIYYLEKYLSNELYSKYTKTETQKKWHLREMYNYLIDCYVKDLKYDKALKICEYFLRNVNSKEKFIIYKKAEILKRKNKLNDSIIAYEQSKQYADSEQDLIYIESKIEDLKYKINKNYTFKPRIKERKRLKVDAEETYDLQI